MGNLPVLGSCLPYWDNFAFYWSFCQWECRLKPLFYYCKYGIFHSMDIKIEFNQSAFKHGFTEENIRYVLNRPCYEGPLEEDDEKYIIIGFDNSGRLLEIVYNFIDDKTINVFHVMKCQKVYFNLLNA